MCMSVYESANIVQLHYIYSFIQTLATYQHRPFRWFFKRFDCCFNDTFMRVTTTTAGLLEELVTLASAINFNHVDVRLYALFN